MRKFLLPLSLLFVSGVIAAGCGDRLPTQSAARTGAVVTPVGPGGAIGDFVWSDLNADGIQDPSEPGIPGVTVRLTSLGLAGDPGGTITTVTDKDGCYRFEGLIPGTYLVEVVPPKDCDLTKPNAGKPDVDSEKNPATVKVGDKPDETVDFGFVCKPPECCPCSGKVTTLTLRYRGAIADARVQVVQKKGGTVFDGVVQPGGTFGFVGTDKKGTLGTDIRVFVNGALNASIHTSCSQPIGPGLVRGDFEVVAGASRNGGPLCPLPGATR